jgi:hypothetical protein
MRISGWYMWGIGIVWVLTACVALGAVLGAGIGFLFGIFGVEQFGTSSEPQLGSQLVTAGALAAWGGAIGIFYGLLLGGITGLTATGLFALMMSRQYSGVEVSTAVVRLRAVLVAGGVQLVGVVILWALTSGDPELLLGATLTIVVAAAVGAVAGPFILRSAIRRAMWQEFYQAAGDRWGQAGATSG